jgi:uncharacterized repeat protein (TIGR04076 family)
MNMFKVRCKVISFDGDEETFPCHFNYKVGDEIYYDGVYFSGRICSGLFATMMPVVHGVHLMGNRFGENIMFKYRGLDARDPNMAKYDGLGFSPRKTLPQGIPPSMATLHPSLRKTTKLKGMRFACSDTRTLAQFLCEAVDLSDSDYCQPFYRRAIAILEKIEAQPGIRTDEILDRFTAFERDEISPPLTPVLLELILEALGDMGYVEVHDGTARATGKEPPSRPTIG